MAVKHFGANGELVGYSYGDNVIRPHVEPTVEQIAVEQKQLKARGLCGECTMPLKANGKCSWDCLAGDDGEEIEVDY